MKKRYLPIYFVIMILAVAVIISILTFCNDIPRVQITGNKTKAVDLGLSVKWATCNIGATLPADYGNYYAWGEIATKSSYDRGNSLTYGDSSLGDISANATYDAARANCGDTWRIPTNAECQELIDCCSWTWTSQENSDGEAVNGYKIVGANGNSIFLPAAGFCYRSSLYFAGAYGTYWSSSPATDNAGESHYFGILSIFRYIYYSYWFYGGSVRPVSE